MTKIVVLRGGQIQSPASSTAAAWVLYLLLLMPGVGISLFAQSLYPPLDSRVPMGFLLSLFLLPVTLQLIGLVLKRSREDTGWWRPVYVCSAAALVLLGILLLANGKLDAAPVNAVKVTILRKVTLRGGRRTQYGLTVSSWRPGRNEENLNVVEGVFDRARVGRPAVLEVHRGYFGLPWIGTVSPE